MPHLSELDKDVEAGNIVSPAVFQLKRLIRDLKARVHDFHVLLDQVLNDTASPDPAAFQRLAADVDRMRQSARASCDIAAASMRAISRGDPAELIILRDQLVDYLAALDRLPRDTPSQPESQPEGRDDSR